MKSNWQPSPLTGRGAAANPVGRFEKMEVVLEPSDDPDDQPGPVRTQFLRDDSQSVLSWNRSPDIPFEVGLNPYRGCEHGCAYCFARPTHEYLGLSAGMDFESKIIVKMEAPALLRRELSRKSWKPLCITMSGVTDCYQPVERRLELTRGCLRVLADFRNPVTMITKNHLVTRDIDILSELAAHRCVEVNVSVTTLDSDLAKVLEPRASPPQRRLKAIRELRAAGVPVRVMMAPIIPGLTDHEIPDLLAAVAEAGAAEASYVVLRLPGAVAPLFEAWLDRHAPGHKDKVLNRLRDMRGGRLYRAQWGKRMRGEGFFADQISALFKMAHRRAGFRQDMPELSTDAFRVPSAQRELFD